MATTQSPNYVKTGYVASNYVKGGIDPSKATKEPLNFIVINEPTSDADILSFIKAKYPKTFQDSITVVFTDKLQVAQTVKGIYSLSALSGQISTQDIANILKSVPDNLLSDTVFMGKLTTALTTALTAPLTTALTAPLTAALTVPVIKAVTNDSTFTSTINQEVLKALTSDPSNITSIANAVMKMIQIQLVAKNGTVITTGLTYNKNTNSYTLNYDTSKLNNTNYTINMKIV